MILGIIIGILIGVFLGFIVFAILAGGKTADMWLAIERAAFNNDTTLCKQLMEMQS